MPPISQFFVEPALREDADLAARLAAPANENSGIFHDHNEPAAVADSRSDVPEYYTPDRAWPLVTALHGGSGNGRGFLWSWLRDARSHGAIVIAPTATNDSGKTTPIKNTWALMGDDTDTPNLTRNPGLGAVALEYGFGEDAADRDERWRHVLLRNRI